MPDTPGWVEVRLLGPKHAVKELARHITQGRDIAVDTNAGPRRDGKHLRAMTVRLRAEPAQQEEIPADDDFPHGETRGYRRHLKEHTTPCDDCLDAHNNDHAARARAREAAGRPTLYAARQARDAAQAADA